MKGHVNKHVPLTEATFISYTVVHRVITYCTEYARIEQHDIQAYENTVALENVIMHTIYTIHNDYSQHMA